MPAFNPKLLRHFEDMEENIKLKKEQILDTRSRARFCNITSELDEGKRKEENF